MTMLSFRVDVQEAAELQRWASELGVDKSELLRNALHTHLVQLAVQRETTIWQSQPLTESELALSKIANWGAAEEWSDWSDEQG